MASWSGLYGQFSALSTAFQCLGRRGPWDATARSGNPVDSQGVADFKVGYRQQLEARGYEEGSAIPWRQGEFWALVDGLDARAGAPGASLFQQVEYSQLALLAAYLWEGAQRGAEAGRLRLTDHTDRWVCCRLAAVCSLLPGTDGRESLACCSDGEPAVPLPAELPDGYLVEVCPNGTKGKRGRAIRPLAFTFSAGVPARYQYLWRLQRHLALCERVQAAEPDFEVRSNPGRLSGGLWVEGVAAASASASRRLRSAAAQHRGVRPCCRCVGGGPGPGVPAGAQRWPAAGGAAQAG